MSPEDFDLSAHAATLGNPDDFFVHTDQQSEPLIVRHADGQPVHVIQADGTLRPYVPRTKPGAAPVTGTVDAVADQAEFGNG